MQVPFDLHFKVSQLLCQNSLLLLAAILHSLVHPTYAMYYPVKILILQKLNLCKVSKKTYMYDELKLTHNTSQYKLAMKPLHFINLYN